MGQWGVYKGEIPPDDLTAVNAPLKEKDEEYICQEMMKLCIQKLMLHKEADDEHCEYITKIKIYPVRPDTQGDR